MAPRPHLRQTAWIWLVGSIVWAIDAVVAAHVHAAPHARLAVLLAALFGAAWLYFRAQP